MSFKARKINGVYYVMPDNIYNWVAVETNIGLPESDLIEEIKCKFVGKGKNMVDIGANVGYYSLSLSKVFKQVYAFEPTPVAYHALCGGIALNGYSYHVHPYEMAIGNECQVGTQTLQIVAEDAGGNSFTNPLNSEKINNDIIVPCNTLDSFDLQDISYIKIDVEGNELEVLEGAVNTINKYKPFISIEIWDKDFYKDKREKVLNYLSALGYSCEKKNWDVWFCTFSKL